jgi:hypothetical protein
MNDTVNSRFKKDLNMQIYLQKAFFSDDQFLNVVHKSFLNQTNLDLRKEKWSFLNQDFTVLKFMNSLSHEGTTEIRTFSSNNLQLIKAQLCS